MQRIEKRPLKTGKKFKSHIFLSLKKKTMDSPVGIMAIVMFIGLGVINFLYSKRDRRFTNAFKPGSLSIKGWIISILWLVGMVFLIGAVG